MEECIKKALGRLDRLMGIAGILKTLPPSRVLHLSHIDTAECERDVVAATPRRAKGEIGDVVSQTARPRPTMPLHGEVPHGPTITRLLRCKVSSAVRGKARALIEDWVHHQHIII